ncbi:hypothetical protein EGW08_008698 [Elysia chlorotica]|uniref:Uncharacterized protein n=1 Tax=Elysia chlorotica TaxID=188477 RepID=A0A433TPL2_ELYCH|nr:hypothetical protein EGW08_008698 [Elysia chlorotica]
MEMIQIFLTSLLLLPLALGTLGPAEEFFDVLGTGLKEWRLVFRGTAYINLSMYTAYKDGSNVPAIVHEACRQTDWSKPCDTHYRNADALAHWSNIMEVLLGVVERGQIVKTAIFKGDNTDYMSWFSESHYINSSWADLSTETHQFFGIAGHDAVKRHFFINHNYNGCPHDAGWLAVVDTITNVPCDWEKDEAFPIIKYAAGEKYENWNTGNFRNADALVVFVKYSSGAAIVG